MRHAYHPGFWTTKDAKSTKGRVFSIVWGLVENPPLNPQPNTINCAKRTYRRLKRRSRVRKNATKSRT